MNAPAFVPAAGEVRKLAGDLKFVEGPVWSEKDGGFLVFSDILAGELKKWTEKDGVTVYREKSEFANGNARTPDGTLVSCLHGSRRVVTERDGNVETLADQHDGKLFNSPNDLVVKSDGMIYFTDPTYGLSNEAQDKTIDLDGRYVFRLDPKTGTTTLLARDFDQPNGLCFSPDEKILYVADSGRPHHVKAFDIRPDGTLANGRVFAVIDNGAPDGIRCDSEGRLWSTAGDGVHVFGADGKLLGKIPVPETPANLCFGGKDWKTLFITARTGLYAVEVNATPPAGLKR